MAERSLILLNSIGDGKRVYLEQGEVQELAALGLAVRRLGNGQYSQLILFSPENQIILEKAGYSFRNPRR